MFHPARLFRSNLLALALFALVMGTAACYGKSSTEENSNTDYCTQNPENC